MTHLTETIKAYLKKVFSDLHNIILGAVVGALIVGGGGVYLFAQKLWTQLIGIAQLPTPLWASTILALGIMEYIYVKIQISAKFSPNNNKIDFIDDGDIKWKATLYPSGIINLEDSPFCVKHNIRLISFNTGHLCKHMETNDCETQILSLDYEYRRKCAEALAEQQFRLMKK